MTVEAITEFILKEFPGSHKIKHKGDVFYYAKKEVADKGVFPFATIVTKDNHFDNVSHLDRHGVYRLNINVSEEIFDKHVTIPKPKPGVGAYIHCGINFKMIDHIMPHPLYGTMNRICINNPSPKNFEVIKQHLKHAYKTQLAHHK